MAASILQTKLHMPLLHQDLVERSRLTKTIQQGIDSGASVILIAAPAGFGKSTAAAIWANQTDQPTAWFSLDEADNEITPFWLYLLAALQLIQPGLGEKVFSALEGTPPQPINGLLSDLLNELAALPEPIALILDDYHVIENPEIHESLQFLIDHQPTQLQLLICTRADPPFALGKLRAARRLTEIRTGELRFTETEGRALLNEVMDLNLTQEEIHQLEKRTEGWGVGLLLAAQSLLKQQDREQFIRSFSGSQNYVLEYLTEEVLNQQTEEVRTFLLKSSILEHLNASLGDTVVGNGDSGKIIRNLERANLFLIPLDTRAEWYRYHHLFRDLLRLFLDREYSEAEIQDLHRAATAWYINAGEIETAIDHSLGGVDYQAAANLIDQIVDQVISRGQVKKLLMWLKEIPEEVIQSRPRLLMHQGWAVFLSGQVSAASKILMSGKKALTTLPDGPERNTLHGKLSAMLATLTALTRDLERAKTEAQEAIRFLPGDELIYLARANRAWGVSLMFQGNLLDALEKLEEARSQALKARNLFLASEIISQIGTVRKHQGDLTAAEAAYQEILDLYAQPDLSPPACLGYIGLAEVALERNQLEKAEGYLKTGIELSHKGKIGYVLQPALLIQGMLRCLQGNQQAARESIQAGEQLSRSGGGSLESILGLAIFQARFHLQCGDLNQAYNWAIGTILPPDWSFADLPVVLMELQQSILANVHLHREEYQKVLKIAERIRLSAENGGRLARVVELSLYQAAALHQLGRISEAMDDFQKSLKLAEQGGNLRFFLEVGPQIQALVKTLEQEGFQNEFQVQFSERYQNTSRSPPL